MQELLRWEIATKDKNSIRTAKLRELHTLPLCKKFADAFAETEIDIVAISALIIGGIYYMILHCELSEFSGINLNNEQDRERMIKAIKYLANILFQTPSYGYSTIKIASKMNRIIYLENGKIVGIGTHQQLMTGCEKYRRYYVSWLLMEND